MKNATRLFFQMRDNRFVTMENVMHNRFDDENFGLFEMCKEIERVSVVERCINSISGSIEREREREWRMVKARDNEYSCDVVIRH